MKLDFSQQFDYNLLTPQSAFEEKVIGFLKEWYSDSETVPVQTSGSTGKPKIFQIEKKRMLDSARMTCGFLQLKPGDSALLCLPVEYISGKMMIVRSIERGLELHVTSPSAKPLENLNIPVDFCAMSPLQVENSLDQIHLIRKLIVGGAQVSESLKTKIHEKLGRTNSTEIYETYGMSETLSHIALKKIYPKNEDWFTTFEGVNISLDDRGCLRIFAPQLNSEILQTNDLVELKNEKQFKFCGRMDNVINTGGLKIHPEELEGFIKKQIPNEAIFVGVPDEKLGEKLIVVIEGVDSVRFSLELDLLFQDLAKQFSKNHKPRKVVFLTRIPRLPNGKIDRRTLKEQF